MRILYVAPLFYGSTAAHRMEALRQLGHDVDTVDTSAHEPHRSRTILYRVTNRMGFPRDLVGANDTILRRMCETAYELLWIDKGRSIHPRVLRRVKAVRPGCIIVSYSPDDMMNPGNQSRYYLEAVPLYDLHVTTKTYNVEELTAMGARRVMFVDNAYDPATHRPIPLSAVDLERWATDVGFIGAFEEERFETMLRLARSGIRVSVRGPGWERRRYEHPNLVIAAAETLGDDYVRAICATRVNLCFLRKANRDRQTTRSIEIPACGAFMLGERTEEHLALFEEGEEAEYFASDEELLSKSRYYLDHEAERLRIAAAGRARCLRSGYGNADRLRRVLEEIDLAGSPR